MTVFAFKPTSSAGGSRFAPEPARRDEKLPDREWGLSAWQVSLVVSAIVVVSRLIAAVFNS